MAHKYVLELKNKVLEPLKIGRDKTKDRRLVGRVILNVKRDGAVCKSVASEGYDPDQGARSLKMAVESRIEDELVRKYLEEDREITENQPMEEYVVDITRIGVLAVYKSGGKAVQQC